jgi:hypothetical protein
MLTADELKGLRSDLSDDQILEGVREFSPELGGDIDQLKKEGIPTKHILDGISEFGGQAQPKKQEGALTSTLNNLRYGVANGAAGLGRTLARFGPESMKGYEKPLQEFAKTMSPGDDYVPEGSQLQWSDPSTWNHIPGAVFESVPRLGADFAGGVLAGAPTGGAGAIPGFVATDMAQTAGPNLDARMENQAPGAQPTAGDYGVALGTSGAEALLNRFGLGKGLAAVPKGAGLKALAQVPGAVAKAAGVEGATGAAGDVVNQVGRTAGTDKGLSIDPNEVGNTALASGAVGGAARLARVGADVNNSIKFRGLDEDSAGRVADALTRNEFDPTDGTKAYKAVSTVEDQVKSQFSAARKEADPLLKSRDATETVDNAVAALDNGGKLTKEHLDELESKLGDHGRGPRAPQRHQRPRHSQHDQEQRRLGQLQANLQRRHLKPR